VLGVQTFGKGSVQTVYPVEDGSGLRLTTALYYTPAGRSIQEVGVEPDIKVTASDAAEAGEPGQPRGRPLRESDLERHFRQQDAAPDAATPKAGSEEEPAEPEPPAPSEPGASATPADDLQLARGLEVLKSWTYFERLHQARAQGDLRAAKTP
jgi:carboxyl-terminal processing protease